MFLKRPTDPIINICDCYMPNSVIIRTQREETWINVFIRIWNPTEPSCMEQEPGIPIRTTVHEYRTKWFKLHAKFSDAFIWNALVLNPESQFNPKSPTDKLESTECRSVSKYSKWVFVFNPSLYSDLIHSKRSRKSTIVLDDSHNSLMFLVRSLRYARFDIAWLVKNVTYFDLIA